jgi:hypothetical protein
LIHSQRFIEHSSEILLVLRVSTAREEIRLPERKKAFLSPLREQEKNAMKALGTFFGSPHGMCNEITAATSGKRKREL